MIKAIENRSDIVRDEISGALLYKETPEIQNKKKISRVENELNTLKGELSQIKQLLERIIDGR